MADERNRYWQEYHTPPWKDDPQRRVRREIDGDTVRELPYPDVWNGGDLTPVPPPSGVPNRPKGPGGASN